ncbi:MAG: hypothetical protein JWN71_1354 [Xanthobacteraceae bacterium]|nr:hypothetical protein [Xanthobacteraceae bacterium]
MPSLRVWPVLLVGGFFGVCAVSAVPAGVESGRLLAIEDDPVAISERAVGRALNVETAQREIEAALKADDIELALSFVELAQSRNVPLDKGLLDRVAQANSTSATAVRNANSFGWGLITGEPDSVAGFAGTALGDLFVFGDVRDAIREGSRLANGEVADELVLGLACVGLAVTAGTYASLGIGAPARLGVSLVKAARKTGRIGLHMGEWLGRSVREVVDTAALKRAFGTIGSDPALAARAAREAVKVEKSRNLFKLAGDVGQIQAKAGTRAALDGLKLAQGPADVARIAKVAEKHGSKTRAVLKLAGRGAIFLSIASFNLASWIWWAAMTLFGLVSALKAFTERTTLRVVHYRKRRRLRRGLALARDRLDRQSPEPRGLANMAAAE